MVFGSKSDLINLSINMLFNFISGDAPEEQVSHLFQFANIFASKANELAASLEEGDS